MLDRINEYGKIKNMNTIDKINDLYTELVTNCLEIDNVLKNIEKYEQSNEESVDIEKLYENEFLLYMNNISIYEDLINYIEKEPRTSENEFELARIKREANKLLKVEVIVL